MKSFRHIILIPFIILCLPLSGFAGEWYVASNGSDTGSGSETDPFKSIEKAVSMVQSGEIIFVRGDTYNLLNTIFLSKSGTIASPISLFAFPGEHPVLNFSGQTLGSGNKGVKLTGSYWHMRGINITGAGDNGMIIEGGNYNLIENCNFYRNRDTGLQIDNGASFNTVRNCDSYYNADPPDYGDADGFAPKLTVGSGNSFYGCRAWKNCDDGWDGYLRGSDDVSTTLENCWAFENGYLENGTDPGASANGNGFKMGGSDDKTLKHNFTLMKCLAFKNKTKGFDQNNNKGSMILYNCTGHNNLVADYRINQVLEYGKILVIKNCIDLGKIAEIGNFAEQAKNSWQPPFVVTAEDFRSIDEVPAYGLRKEDGELPDIDYMHIAPGSDLIDAGVDLGLPYVGISPDLGCFETIITGVYSPGFSMEICCNPNPVSDNGWLRFSLNTGGRCEIRLYDISSRCIKTLADQIVEAGEQHININMSDVRYGLYICRINLNQAPVLSVRIVKGNL